MNPEVVVIVVLMLPHKHIVQVTPICPRLPNLGFCFGGNPHNQHYRRFFGLKVLFQQCSRQSKHDDCTESLQHDTVWLQYVEYLGKCCLPKKPMASLLP